MGGLQTVFGGRNTIYTELCETAREEAYELMVQHAQQHGANAVINMRYDANEVLQGGNGSFSLRYCRCGRESCLIG